MKKEEKEENKELAEDEEEPPSVLTPRKRLMNFKIPLVNRGGGQRRDQHHSVVARRRLYGGELTARKKSENVIVGLVTSVNIQIERHVHYRHVICILRRGTQVLVDILAL